MKRLTVTDARHVAESIARAIGADPSRVIVRGQRVDDRMYAYSARITRDEYVDATGYARRDALENLYDTLLERETHLRRQALKQRAKCEGKVAGFDRTTMRGTDAPGSTCLRPAMYSFTDGKLRDRFSPVRLGQRSVEYPDATFVYADSLDDLSRRVTRKATKNGKTRKRRVTRAKRSR